MSKQLKNNFVWFLICAMATTFQASHAQGGVIVSKGYDLLYTMNASFDFGGVGGLNLVNFVGKPLPSPYDFGGGLGQHNIGATDTILHRLEDVSLPDFPALATQTIALEMVALSLQSATAIDWSNFGGNASEFIRTVNLVDNGSTMTIKNDFTFDSALKFSFQLEGVTSGVLSPVIPVLMTQIGSTWSHDPSTANPQPVLLAGINRTLNGIDNTTDFFTGIAKHGPDHIHETVDINAVVPEPGSIGLFGLCLAAGANYGRKRLRRNSK